MRSEDPRMVAALTASAHMFFRVQYLRMRMYLYCLYLMYPRPRLNKSSLCFSARKYLLLA